ncbi:MAG: TRAP transporter large permease [Marinibacterium sp.]|nr:TRAP transporter large permease [Marinibacterium sp.]
MSAIIIGAWSFCSAVGLLILRTPIAFALSLVASISMFLMFASRTGTLDFDRAWTPATSLIFSSTFEILHKYELSMIPLFVALGHISYHAQITTKIYHAARIWMNRIPGGVAMASILGCGGFSAVTGSSIACASTMGRICCPEMLRIGYDPRLATSSVAVGGTLGSLIPPSVLFILYGIFTETSISQLFLAGVLPGLLSLAGFLLVVYIWVRRKPEVAPMMEDTVTRAERFRALLQIWPALLLFLIIIGGIYGGIFTPTEAAAVSLAATIAIGLAQRLLTFENIWSSLKETAYQTTTLFILAAAAKMFVGFIALTGVAGQVSDAAQAANLSPAMLLLLIAVIYLVLGMFMDPIGIMILTLPIFIPLVEGFNMDLIWFGVVVIKLLEISLITPPVGLNAFVIASVTSSSVKLDEIFAGIARFLTIDILVLILIIAFPVISLLIPNSM